MSKPTKLCSFEAGGVPCGKPRYCRGYCTGHYRQDINGKPLTPLRDYVRQEPECLAEGCHEKPHAHGYCKFHLNHVERHGDPSTAGAHNPGATCKVEADGERCPEPVKAKGYCEVHYMRVRRHGEPGPIGSQANTRRGPGRYAGESCKAEVDGERCPRSAKSKGWCQMHYNRFKRTGDAIGKHGLEPHKSRGYITSDGYFVITVNGRKILEHRLVMESIIGRPLERFEEPHHKNGIRDDNHPDNLELWTHQPSGQRVEDLIDFVLTYYPDEVRAQLSTRP